jgi:mannosyltransferase
VTVASSTATTELQSKIDRPIASGLLANGRRLFSTGPTALLLGVIAAVLSGAWSWQPSLWSDEIATLRAARLSWGQLSQFVQHKDAVHAAYYSLMHLWIGAFGQSEFAIRAPSAIAVGLAAAGLSLLARHFGSARLAVIAATVFMILPRTTYMGAEARSYAISTAIVVWTTLALVRAAKSGRRSLWVVYVTLLTLSTVLFVYSLLIVVVHATYVLTRSRSRTVVFRWLAGTAIATGLCTPFLLFAMTQKQQIAWLAEQPVVNVWTIIVEPYFDSSWLSAALVIMLLATAITIRSTRAKLRLQRGTLTIACVWAIGPLLVLLLANLVDGPLYLARYLSFCAPGLALLVAMIILALPARVLPAIAAGLILLAAIPTYVSQRVPYAKNGGSDLAEVASYVAGHARHGDAVFFSEAGPSTLRPRLALYGYPTAFSDVRDIAFRAKFNRTGKWSFSDATLPLTREVGRLSGVARVWYIEPGTKAACRRGKNVDLLESSGYEMHVRFTTHRETICEFARDS